MMHVVALSECPHCGASFRSGRLACPECGSDARTGWRDAEDIDYLSTDIPDLLPDVDTPPPAVPTLRIALVVALLIGFVLVFVLRWR